LGGQAIALTRDEGRTILVIEDPGGRPLDRILEPEKEQPLKPENVLANDDGHVWLTGFGIASRLPRERQGPAPPETVAGRANESLHRYP
jgi:hypothetical protein